MTIQEVLFGGLTLVTHVMEAVTGFGSTVVALPFGIALVGVSVAVPVLALHVWLLSAYVVVVDRKQIQWRQYITVMCFVLLGMPVGMWAFTAMPELVLKAALSLFMLAVSANGIRRAVSKAPAGAREPEGLEKYILFFLLIVGGVIHGAFGSGGPLLIIYVTRVIREKRHFRATMCAFWFSLNLILLVRNLVTGVFAPEVVRLSVVTLPFLAAGVLAGNWAHHKISDKHFTLIVYVVLFISGGFMAYSSIPGLFQR